VGYSSVGVLEYWSSGVLYGKSLNAAFVYSVQQIASSPAAPTPGEAGGLLAMTRRFSVFLKSYGRQEASPSRS